MPAVAADASWRVTGQTLPGLDVFDRPVQSFMQSHGITCAQLAISRNGKLGVARGYTLSSDEGFTTQPTSPFRIASISKPFTGTAVALLVEQGKLSLTDRVADVLGWSATADPRHQDITVLHLLEHEGGWDRDATFDPMFYDAEIATALGKPLPISQSDIVAYMLQRPLDFAPGSRSVYSNFGYMLLGRVIEKVAGTSYADFVRQHVLAPVGITRMALGHSVTPAVGEVPYVSATTVPSVMDDSRPLVPLPYGGYNLENMDAHGGWLSSGVDLVRYADRYFIATMTMMNRGVVPDSFTAPIAGSWTWEHDGSLPGDNTALYGRSSGDSALMVAILFNARNEQGADTYIPDVENVLLPTIDGVSSWPGGDLSARYFEASPTSPARPAKPHVHAGKGTLTITWSAPASGGAAITGYVVTVGKTTKKVKAGTTSLTLHGLKKGTYRITVTAVNRVGASHPSPAATAKVA